MGIKNLGNYNGKDIYLYEISDGKLAVSISNFGGTITSIRLNDKSNILRDVVLGFDEISSLTEQDQYIGATIGRYANRINGSKFTLGNTEYKLLNNEGDNQLHGGGEFNKAVFSVKEYSESKLSLFLHSNDGTNGFPGNIDVLVTFTVENKTLRIDYSAQSDKDTVLNLTNHSYFNLNGENNGNILNHSIKINAPFYTELLPNGIPTGKILPVDNTVFDLRSEVIIGEKINSQELSEFKGFDHNFCLSNTDDYVAFTHSDKTGIALKIKTNMPGIQFYTSNMLGNINVKGKHNAQYSSYSGLCLETQFYPDSPNHENFPSCVLKANEKYNKFTEYNFDII